MNEVKGIRANLRYRAKDGGPKDEDYLHLPHRNYSLYSAFDPRSRRKKPDQ